MRATRRLAMVAAVLLTGATIVYASNPPKVDPALPAYKAVSGVSGNLSSIGSDSLNNVMTLWAETFSKFYPNAKIQIEGKGSTTAPDRKSTRLNSSHRCISYAVFCLKKKRDNDLFQLHI